MILSKKTSLLLVLLFLSAMPLFATKISITEFEHEIWRLTNEQRAVYALPPLDYEEGLADLARSHSHNMLSFGFFSHKDHKGWMVTERHQKNYPQLIISSIGENLARFTNTEQSFSPAEIVEGWMNSPEHRKNMLDPDYTHLGVGVVTRDAKLLATQNFATAIARLDSSLPIKMSRQECYRLEFTYLSSRPWQQFNAMLRYPNPKTKFVIDDKHYSLGIEPVKITWLDEERFEVDISFKAGKGNYNLSFGFNGGYFTEGVKMKVK